MKQPINIKFWLNFSLTAIIVLILPPMLMLGLAFYLAGATTLECTRVENSPINCSLNTYHWLGLVKKEVPLKNLVGARLERYNCSTTDADGEHKKTCEQLILETAREDVHPDLSNQLVSKIQAFIYSSNATDLKVRTIHWGFSLALILFASVWSRFGFAFLWNSRGIPAEGVTEGVDGEDDEEEETE